MSKYFLCRAPNVSLVLIPRELVADLGLPIVERKDCFQTRLCAISGLQNGISCGTIGCLDHVGTPDTPSLQDMRSSVGAISDRDARVLCCHSCFAHVLCPNGSCITYTFVDALDSRSLGRTAFLGCWWMAVFGNICLSALPSNETRHALCNMRY